MKVRTDNYRRLFDVLDSLVDERVGIVQWVREVRREPGAPEFFHYAAQACNTAAFCPQQNFGATGGAAARREVAMAKAVGEAVERYSAALYRLEDFPLHAADQAPFKCAQPASFALYSDGQYDSTGFPWVRFTDSTPVRWTKAQDPLSGESIYVPAAFVWIPYHFVRGSGDSPIGQPISTGLACHVSPAQASVSALCEVAERDAFTLMWQGRMSMPRIRIETLSDENYDLAQRLEFTGDRVALLNLTNDLQIPTILAVLRCESKERPALVFAASADLDPELATRKALEELAHTRRYSQQITTRLPRLVRDPSDQHENVSAQMDHLNFYCDHDNAQLAEFVTASKERIEFDEIENATTHSVEGDLEELCQRMARAGHQALITDLTSPDVAELGLNVVRAVVPGLHPLFMGHRLRALGGTRLWTVPQRLGYPGVSKQTGDNPAPHPYP